MTRRRWIADRVEGNQAVLVGKHARHLSTVLRARVGQQFDIVTPDGARLGEITSIADDEVTFLLKGALTKPPLPSIELALAIFKFDRMEWAIEKAVELGVARIRPIAASRSEKHLLQAAEKRVERWRKIAAQAAEQSRRSEAPEIGSLAKLTDLLEAAGQGIVLSETGESTSLKEAIATVRARPLLLAIGPEGGWTDAELAQFQQKGWISASLGMTILRAETAALAALAVTFSELQ